jgi:cytidine deaminase
VSAPQGGKAISKAEIDRLVAEARAVRSRAYAPYSHYPVGAALLADDGRVFLGVNVENSAYPSSLCAEHNAVGAAVTAGVRKLVAVAVCSEKNKSGRSASPCGKCRQVLSELGPDLVVIMAPPEGEAEIMSLVDLLPRAFSAEDL